MPNLYGAGASPRVLFAATLLFSSMVGQAQPAPATKSPDERPSPKYEVIVPGLIGNTPFVLQFRTDDLRLVVRDLIMGRGEARDVPMSARAVMELRGGSVITTINGEKKTRTQGDIWTVGKSDRLSLENPYDVVVIRATYVFERGR